MLFKNIITKKSFLSRSHHDSENFNFIGFLLFKLFVIIDCFI